MAIVILSLAVLAVGVGLILMWVAGQREVRGDRAASSHAGRMRPISVGRRVNPEGRDPSTRSVPRRVDRAKLARLLRQGSPPGGVADPEARPGSAPGSSAGSGPAARGSGDPEDDADTTVWPLTAKGIRGAIRARIAEIKECYDGWLAADDELGGKLVLAFTIETDPEGELARVSNTEIQDSSLDHPGLERCVLIMAESLRFEAPAGGKVTVRYPLRFRPAAD